MTLFSAQNSAPPQAGPDVSAGLLSDLFDELFPICRSITGPGLRKSLEILGRHLPLEREQVASGTRVFDWIVPPEWHIRGARLTGPDGQVYADFAAGNLQVVNYAAAVDRRLSLEALRPHLHSLPDLPDAVPYVTSYYRRDWGFCLPHRVLETLPQGSYRAWIDSSFEPGGVDFAQAPLDGENPAEILITSYLCHPSLANNELSGPLVLLGLYQRIARWPRRRFSYRFVINPETIGSLCFLHRYGDRLRRKVVGGVVLTCLGGPSARLRYKASRRGDGLLDLAAAALAGSGDLPLDLEPFDPTSGSDERQYCSPGFNLPVGQIARTVYGRYAAYHSSLDDKVFMGIAPLLDAIDGLERLLRAAEIAGPFRNLSPFGEPQLGRRDLYPNVNAPRTRAASSDDLVDQRTFLNRVLTVLSCADGSTPMVEVAARCGCTLEALAPVIESLERERLLAVAPWGDANP